MKPVCVITGGGSGMGRATAKLVCEACLLYTSDAADEL